MSKLDVYLRSIEKFGAACAVLTSNQAITLRFPSGDRHATQVTPHDQLVGLVREVAPPDVLDLVDRQRPARFDYESGGARYGISVMPRAGVWQVTIEAAAEAPRAAQPPAARPPATAAAPAGDLLIERGRKKYHLQLQDYPELAAFINSIRGTLAGDLKALERNYTLSLDGAFEGWTLQLLPLDAKMQAVLRHIRIAGLRDQVRSIEITQTDGDSSLMTIEKMEAQ